MAKVTIHRRFPDDDDIRVTIDVENDYPDALSQALATALRGFREACGVALGDES